MHRFKNANAHSAHAHNEFGTCTDTDRKPQKRTPCPYITRRLSVHERPRPFPTYLHAQTI